ncbi:hypothetical protein [Lysinibacillus xylanilyticus]|uniref:hypothetical protein n=1 Tax=Lysinibacillus xylanilyticus TaxID=582475 RepID=UPI003D05506F
MTNIVLLTKRQQLGFVCAKVQRQQQQKRLIGRPQEALLCAKAKRQRQSAQPERKSAPYFAEEPHFI